MIIEVSSGKSGLANYLEHGKKQGRDFHRDEIDQRVPLYGDLKYWAAEVENLDATGNQYDHFTLSFSEDYIPDEMLQKAVEEFREHLFAAWPESERYRIPFYAEAHRPKIQTYTNSQTGEIFERKTHIHIGVGRHDLLTGKHVQLTGYLGQEANDNFKYLDAFQEAFNARHGLSSPKLSPRITPENAIDILARYTGQVPNALGTFNERKADIETKIQRAVIDQGVTNWKDFEKLLKQFGEVSKVRAGRANESFAIKPGGSTKRMRLEGVFFQREFIERPTAEKVTIVQARARDAFVEQMAPRLEPAHLASTLDEWHQIKSREIRHLHTGSDFYKNEYLPADAKKRMQILDELERKSDGIQSLADRPKRQVAPSRNRLQKLPVRDLDAVQRRSEMLLRGDDDLDVRTAPGQEQASVGVRQADGRSGRGRATGPLKQPNNVLSRLQDELRERYEQAQSKEKFAEIRKHIDGEQLLAKLSHSHGLRTGIYSVKKAADGSARIVCGKEAVTPNDFLTKHMGLTWREAAPILREVYELQIGKRVLRAKGQQSAGVESRRLWKAFQELRSDKAAAKELESFDLQTIVGRRELENRLAGEKRQGLLGLSGPQAKAVRAAQTLHAATAKAEYNETRKEARRKLRPPQKDAWRLFLQEHAQAGNAAALRALRRLDDSARDADAITISGVGQVAEEEAKRKALASSEVLKTLSTRVEVNGDVTFTQAGRDVLRDQGQRLEVLDPGSDEAIVAGLLLAQQMYGNTLTLTGPAEFQARVVSLSVERGLPIKFADPQLEAQRVQLRQHRSLAEFEKQTTKVIKDFKAEKRAELEKAKETLEKQTTEAMAAEKAAAKAVREMPPEDPETAMALFLERHKGLAWCNAQQAAVGTLVESEGHIAVLHLGRGKQALFAFPSVEAINELSRTKSKGPDLGR
jgi:hypothetical protein